MTVKWVTFSGTLLNDAVLYNETLDQAREKPDSNFVLAPAGQRAYAVPILPPLEEGKSWSQDLLDAFTFSAPVATEYRLGERAFTIKFPFPQDIGSPSDYVVMVNGFSDGSRTPMVEGGIDILGYGRIHVE